MTSKIDRTKRRLKAIGYGFNLTPGTHQNIVEKDAMSGRFVRVERETISQTLDKFGRAA